MSINLDYSKYGKQNRYLFLHNCADICVFVEDINKEYEYEMIFQKLFKKTALTFKFLAQDGKSGVKKAYYAFGESADNNTNVYIVDADFDFVLQKDIINNNHFIYLKRYNVESYLIDENSIVKYAAYLLKKTQKETRKIIDIENWLDINYKMLEKLFINFIISQYINPSKKTLSLGAYKFIHQNGYFDEVKIDKYINNLKNEYEEYDEVHHQCLTCYSKLTNSDPKSIVCGKFVLKCLCCYLRCFSTRNFKEDDLKNHLINNIDISNLEFLKRQIIGLMVLES